MREIALFVEDSAHRQIIGPLVERIASEQNLDVRLDWRCPPPSTAGRDAERPVVKSGISGSTRRLYPFLHWRQGDGHDA